MSPQADSQKRERLRAYLSRRVEREAYPLTGMQEATWLLSRLHASSAIDTIPIALHLTGLLDREALRASWAELVARHAALRLAIGEQDGQPIQVIAPAVAEGPWRTVDLCDQPAAACDALRREEGARGFDLTRAPLWRVCLIQRGPAEHVLLLTLHHLICDGWSMHVLVRELTQLYAARQRGEASPLAAAAIDYGDYVRWAHAAPQAAAHAADLAYWRTQLREPPAAMPLIGDRPWPAVPRFTGAVEPVAVPAALTAALRARSQRAGVTLFMTLLAGFQMVLAHYTGEPDVIVGTPVANRPRPELEGLVGLLANVVAVRTSLAGAPTSGELLARVRTAVLEAFAHQRVPFARVVQAVQPGRALAHQPLFQVMFALQAAPLADLTLPGLTVRLGPAETGHARFLLTAILQEHADRVEGSLEYSTELFEAATIRRLWTHYLAVLARLAEADASHPLLAQPWLPAAERATLLAWGQGAADGPAAPSVVAAFEAWAAHQPAAAAVTGGGETLSYGTLNAEANQVARWLRRHGLGPGSVVGLVGTRTPALVRLVLGVLKAGAAYLSLAAEYPPVRVQAMIAEAAPALILGPEERPPADGEATTNLDLPLAPTALAYVIYTSGSTGRPKGVLVTHGGLAAFAAQLPITLGTGPGSRVLQFASFSFDAWVLEFTAALSTGATLCLAPREALLPGPALAATLREQAITIAFLPPSALAVMDPPMDAPALTTIMAVAEAFAPSLLATWARSYRFLNGYGPTEITVAATFAGPLAPDAVPVIGRPVRQTRLYVLDRAGELAPQGVPGELFIGGEGVARGYLQRPALTAERFLPDPFAATPGARCYRSGDRVRWRDDATLEFLGRLDRQVKLRGFRIELGEVEAVLREHPQLSEAVVLLRETASSADRALVAYVRPRAGDPAAARELRHWLTQRLPEWMVPSVFVPVETFPRLPSGKVDTENLLARPIAEASPRTAPPRTALDATLMEIWRELLGREHIGLDDNFFEHGGHSLLLTRLGHRIRAVLDIDVPPATLYRATTIRALADAIEELRGLGTHENEPPISRESQLGPIPLSPVQEQLWTAMRMHGEQPYNVPIALHLTGLLDREALRASWAELVARHAALRLAIGEQDGQPIQVIAPAVAEGPWRTVDLCDQPAAACDALRREEGARGFDLTRAPLWRVCLIQRGPAEHVLLLTLHHLICDGWSMHVLVRELTQLYAARQRGEPSPLAAAAIDYGDYVRWAHAAPQAAAHAADLAYWQTQLREPPAAMPLIGDRPWPAVPRFTGAVEPVAVPAALTAALRARSQRAGVTLFMTLLAGFQVVLAHYTGEPDVIVGTPVANRPRPELEGLVGLLANVVAVRTSLAGAPTSGELLARVRTAVLEAFAHQRVPFARVVQAVQPGRALAHQPLFQVMFALQAAPLADLTLPGLTVRLGPAETGHARFLLTAIVQEHADRVEGSLEYSTELFEAATIRRLWTHYLAVLARLAEADASHPLLAQPWLPAAERATLLAWGQGADDGPAAPSVVAAFEAWAAHQPAAPAVTGGGETLSYGTLNAEANQVARWLRRHGLGPGSVVGLVGTRTPALVRLVLGVLKAGAAYLPLAAEYPPARVQAMIAEAAPALILGPEERPPADGEATTNLDLPLAPTALAYVIYTSGSTGRPKGVLVTHGGLAAFAAHLPITLATGPGSRVLQFASFSFDAWVLEFTAALSTGATLCLAPREALLPGPALAATLREQAITIAILPPSTIAVLDGETPLPALDTIVAIGEMVTPSLLATWARSCRFLNGYGPTETTICATFSQPLAPDAVPVIGRPVRQTRLYVLDRAGELAPQGVPGELFIGGEGVARGYLQRPALTAERFLPDPFAATPGARCYRSGDRVRWRDDATLEFLGRLDRQVKLRGFRIELGEIENHLAGHPDVQHALVDVVDHDHAHERRLVAWIARPPAAAADRSWRSFVMALREYLSKQLPAYMIPQQFVCLADVPRTLTGKIDRARLPVPGPLLADDQQPAEATATPIEQVIRDVWSRTLAIERPGRDDNFFGLGGDSILALQVVSRCAQAGVDVSVQEIYRHPTISGLAAVARVRDRQHAIAQPVDGDAPLTPIECWFFEHDFADPHHWNQSLLLETTANANAAWLSQAFAATVRVHPALTSRVIREHDGTRRRSFDSRIEPPALEIVDLSMLPAMADATAITRIATARQASLDFEHGPLIAAAFFDRGPHHTGRLFLAVHHLAVDGLSWRILLDDLHAAYASLAAGRPIVLQSESASFREWARQLALRADEPALRRELRHRHRQLASIRRTIPRDFADGTNDHASEERVECWLSPETSQALLRDVPARAATTSHELLLAALAGTLDGWIGSEPLAIEVEAHGREAFGTGLDLSRTVGWFTALSPFVLPASAAAAPLDTLAVVEQRWRTMPFAGRGYGVWRYLCARDEHEPDAASNARPEVAFNFLGQVVHDAASGPPFLGLAPEPAGPTQSPRAIRPHLLAIIVLARQGRVAIEWIYSRHVHRRDTIEQLAATFITRLEDLLVAAGRQRRGGTASAQFAWAPDDLARLKALAAHAGPEKGPRL